MDAFVVEKTRPLGIPLAYIAIAFAMWLRCLEANRVPAFLAWLLAVFAVANVLSICFYLLACRGRLLQAPFWMHMEAGTWFFLGITTAVSAYKGHIYQLPWYHVLEVLRDKAAIVLGVCALLGATRYLLTKILRAADFTQNKRAAIEEARDMLPAVCLWVVVTVPTTELWLWILCYRNW